ncbi:hypothetical protein BD769DRAFT_1450172 [Suillus cothurnatus]|nr:hypothetical protein BD769DRAFT_1450172 [Suillus cothurnatus]
MMIRPLTDAFHSTVHAMREIIDSQTAASFQNYAGTHFWNTQESYLITMFEPIIRHDLSFEKGRSFQNQPILCPHFFCIRPEVHKIQSLNAKDSIHYGHLTKAISTLSVSYTDVRALVHEDTQKRFALVGENVDVVRVVVGLPRQISLANNFEVEVITPRGQNSLQKAARVSVKDLVIPVLIGINPPERLAKQKVITNIMFYEKSGMHQVDYPAIINQISEARTFFLPSLTEE